ncbi:hypothetical protein B0H17DRAFT_1151819 [Mycena rosella]|uniref:Uncharacterized protein n=1 Tax=Mycena rosella TaxID=1033263 RepID=A0AAD7BI41_MYCRO|nr:hypothetical protein B0H17DRAFT_1151819 [Mycena rosella]
MDTTHAKCGTPVQPAKGIVTAFRSSIYLPTYIASNAHLFIDDDWINVVQIRDFLQGAAGPAPDLAPGPPDTPLTRVKVEHDASTTRLSATADVKTRILKEGGQEVVEILDSDTDSDCEIGGGILQTTQNHRLRRQICVRVPPIPVNHRHFHRRIFRVRYLMPSQIWMTTPRLTSPG